MLSMLFVLDAYLPGGLFDFIAGGGEDALRREQTTAFTTFVLFEFCDVLNSVSQRKSLWQRHRNPWLLGALAVSLALHAAVICWPPLQQAFGTVPLAAVD
jgi:Ca2+-transporting ATPase